MIDEDSLDEIIYSAPSWKAQILGIHLKHFENKVYIDVRKWLPLGYELEGKYRKSKGVMLSVEDWPAVIEAVQKILNNYLAGHTSLNDKSSVEPVTSNGSKSTIE